jgi:hypothetical protein
VKYDVDNAATDSKIAGSVWRDVVDAYNEEKNYLVVTAFTTI